MILRKPYAFFIKYFRIINLIMAVLMTILIYFTFKTGRFFTEYSKDYAMASDGFVTGHYVNFYIFLLILLIIILTIVVTSVMFVKNKPKKLYLFNLLTYVLLIVLYMINYNTMHTIGDQILDIRVSKALRDINYIALGLQAVSLIMTLIRATGFDIKSFDFGKDLQELEIDVKDNEEFEVAVDFDRNEVRRSVRSKTREFKYFYVEHKFLINVILIILAVIIIFSIFITRNIYTDYHKESQIFTASTLQFNIKGSYLTSTDEEGTKITDKTLVVVKFDVRKLSEAHKKALNTGLVTLMVGGKSFGQTLAYNENFHDMGTPYTGDKLSIDFTSYILIFEIPKEFSKKSMSLKINDNVSYVRGQMGAKNIYVKLKPMDLTKNQKTEDKIIGDTISFSGSLLGESTLVIQKYEIGNKFKIEYQFCSKKDKCNTSYEYLTPTATGNYFKTLMKINGTFEEDENMNLDDVDSLFQLLNKYGYIHYQLDGTWYEHKINSQRIKPKAGMENGTYIEINKDAEKATSIYLTFNVRNYVYKYILK